MAAITVGQQRFESDLEALEASKDRNPHLAQYLERWAMSGAEPPLFLPTLARELRSVKTPNILYPVGDPIFIHIYPGEAGKEINTYHPIEPSLPPERQNLMGQVELKMLSYVDENTELEGDRQLAEFLVKLLKEVCHITDNPRPLKPVNQTTSLKGQVEVTPEEYQALEYLIQRDRVGLGMLEPLIRDPYIEDISCDGLGPLYVQHKVFQSLVATIGFDRREDLDHFALWLGERAGKQVSHRAPIVDAILPDGSRLNLVYGTDVSLKGSNFTIRKFTAKPLSITTLIRFKTLNATAAAYLWMLLREGMSLFICGETASGKTTTLTAIIPFITYTSKIITIEDTPEVKVPHPNWVREVTRPSDRQESNVGMFELLKAALRQRPNYIIVGEIRGVEGNVAFQAMMTGHPVLATFHAASVPKTIQRLTGHPILVPKTNINNLNCIVIQNAVYDAQGNLNRRVMAVNEIIDYNAATDSFSYIEAFSWLPDTDELLFSAESNSFLLERKIARRRGLPEKQIKKIYEELEARARFLQRLVEKKVFDYEEVFARIAEEDAKLARIGSKPA
jgi:flagellar protein FlaI